MIEKKQQNFFEINGNKVRTRLKRKNCIRLLLNEALELFGAESAGIVFGTNAGKKAFLPANEWDRGILRYLASHGLKGIVLRYFCSLIARLKKINPILLYEYDEQGQQVNAKGIIAYVLRSYSAFYKTGVNVLIVPDLDKQLKKVTAENKDAKYLALDIFSYNGIDFSVPKKKLLTTVSIVRAFNAKNFLGVLIPDYGILIINTGDGDLLRTENGTFVNKQKLSDKLDIFIESIETGSLEILSTLAGKQGAELLWHKEINLRKTARELNKKEIALNLKEDELERQRSYLRAVGGVTEKQLNMEPIEVHEGVYTFIDMVGSATVRKFYNSEEYFFLTNTGRQIFALATRSFYCRLDNYIGDAVFIENNRIFDHNFQKYQTTLQERCVIVVLILLNIFNELHLLSNGGHPIDPQGRVCNLLRRENQTLSYRAGMDAGAAVIGPIGAENRKIVTGIGKAVDNASRLESTGKSNAIHLSKTVYELIQHATISKQSSLLFKIMTDEAQRPGHLFKRITPRLLAGESLQFNQLYSEMRLSVKQAAVENQTFKSIFDTVEGVRYKEYQPGCTYLLWPAHQDG